MQHVTARLPQAVPQRPVNTRPGAQAADTEMAQQRDGRVSHRRQSVATLGHDDPSVGS